MLPINKAKLCKVWLAGLLISVIFLLAEIIIHRMRKSQTEVGMLMLEEPSVPQSTPESGNLGDMVQSLFSSTVCHSPARPVAQPVLLATQ